MLAACGKSPVEKAQQNLDFLNRNNASKAELCDAKRKLADAYREALDDKHYQFAKLDAQIACLGADLDNLERR